MKLATDPAVELPAGTSSASVGPLTVGHSDARTIRIVHVINDLTVGGAEMMLYKLLSRMDRSRYEPVVISLIGGGGLRESIEGLGVPVYGLEMKPPAPTPASLWRLRRLMCRLDPDLIQGWMYHGSLAAQFASVGFHGRAATLWNIRQSVYSLGHEKSATALVIRLCAHLSERPAVIIYNSRTSAAQHGALGYHGRRAHVIHNGFDTAVFSPSAEARASVRAELGVAAESLLIGLVGRYHPAKDHANFLRGAAALRESHADARFVLSGRGVHQGNEALCELIGQLGLDGRVQLLGERQDIPRLMASFDIAVSSSFEEGFPNVVGEAMSCGVPCVVTDVSDLPWVVGETGRVVPPRNPSALADGLKDLIALGREGRRRLGQAARARVTEFFELELIVGKYEAMYEDIYQKHRNLRPLGGASSAR
jgi:glycosyltransferase involved in cell wall biosynthesis